jgi:hypothetical protein
VYGKGLSTSSGFAFQAIQITPGKTPFFIIPPIFAPPNVLPSVYQTPLRFAKGLPRLHIFPK